MYEHHTVPLLSRGQFAMRMASHVGAIGALVAISLLVGMVGYHALARMSWVDSFLNSSMLLGGMGPVGDLPNDTAKIFAGVYALYAGLVFIVTAALLFTPLLHRLMHRFHWDDK